jgi:hypothetical protein
MVALLAAAVLAGCGGGDGLSGSVKDDFIAGCEDGGQPKEACECLVTELENQGVDTESKLEDLNAKIQKAIKERSPSDAPVPDEYVKSLEKCQSKLNKGG